MNTITLDNKRKKKLTVLPTKPNPPTIIARRTTFAPSKPEPEKIEKIEKLDNKVKKPILKPKVDINPRPLKTDKSTKLVTNNIVTSKIQPADFDSLRPLSTTNAALKQTRENQKILAEMESQFSVMEDLDSGRNLKRYSDLVYYPQDIKNYIAARKKEENINPNFEDNNLANQVDQAKRHLRNVSNLQRHQGRIANIATGPESAKLQDITNLRRVGKTSAQPLHDHTISSASNTSYSQSENLLDEYNYIEQQKPRNLPKRRTHAEDQVTKPKVCLYN